jgi:hypothetical protein
MMDPMLLGGEPLTVPLTFYTDAFVIRGSVRTRQRRLTDILNEADDPFLVISDATIDEYGTAALASKAEYAQVNLATVLFAVSDDSIESRPDLRTPKIPEMAMITIPPFRITGRIHLMPERPLHEALSELTGSFLPVTDAVYWSDTAGEARATSQFLAFNHNRAHILAPHTEIDPWHGLDRTAMAGGAIANEGAATAAHPNQPVQDPWGDGTPTTTSESQGGGW